MAADVYLLSFKPPRPADKVFAALSRYGVGDVNHVVISTVFGEETISFLFRV
jgi:hypothetical protein